MNLKIKNITSFLLCSLQCFLIGFQIIIVDLNHLEINYTWLFRFLLQRFSLFQFNLSKFEVQQLNRQWFL